MDVTTVWTSVLEHIRGRVKPQQFETWFPKLRCLSADPARVVLSTPNDFMRKWVETHYLPHIKEACFHALGAEPVIEVRSEGGSGPQPALVGVGGEAVAASARGAAAVTHASSTTSTTLGTAAIDAALEESARAGAPAAHLAAPAPHAEARDERAHPRFSGDIRLNPQYVFEQFVVGPSNRLAHAASVAVTENPARTYNPLFLHGGVGLGKTHLLQAVCHAMLARHPHISVVYLSCEAFVNQYISSLQSGNPEAFRTRYRAVDMLLIDDIHFLANKVAMQEEFFHTFNTLYNAQRQIILSSDSSPQEIPALEQRLVSRFKWGLVAEIEPPHFETKVAIIRAKALARGRELPDDVTRFLAESLDSNIREIEGAVTKVILLAGIQNQRIDVPLCQDALRELMRKPGQVNLNDIMNHVATHYHVKVNDLLSKRRSKAVALPRQVSMYLARMLTHLSLEEIGGQMGGRDHTTVLYAEGKMRALREKDPEVRSLLEKLTRELGRGAGSGGGAS